MKLLILTQKANKDDPILGFFHSWILEFAKHCEKVLVICLEKGNYELPENVRVLSLGKESEDAPLRTCLPVCAGGRRQVARIRINEGSKIKNLKKIVILLNCYILKLQYIWNFYKYIWQERKNYDAVFVHMNPEYVMLGGMFWKLWNKKIGLWYVHKAVNLKLRIAEKLSDIIFTVSESSFKIKSDKVKILGHGIDLQESKKAIKQENKNRSNVKIICVGRISEIKNQKLLLEAADVLINNEKIKNLKFQFIGAPIYESDKIYFNELKNLAKAKNLCDYFEFVGSIPYEKIFEEYNQADLTLNLCDTGGVDKVVLESMACGCLVIAYNKAFENILPRELILCAPNKQELAEKIKWVLALPEEEKKEFKSKLINEVAVNHNLENLINNISELLKKR